MQRLTAGPFAQSSVSPIHEPCFAERDQDLLPSEGDDGERRSASGLSFLADLVVEVLALDGLIVCRYVNTQGQSLDPF